MQLVWLIISEFGSNRTKISDTLHEGKLVYVVDSRGKRSVARPQCRWKTLLPFHDDTQQNFLVYSDMWLKNEMGMHCCFFWELFKYSYTVYTHLCGSTKHGTHCCVCVTMVTRTLHNVTL